MFIWKEEYLRQELAAKTARVESLERMVDEKNSRITELEQRVADQEGSIAGQGPTAKKIDTNAMFKRFVRIGAQITAMASGVGHKRPRDAL